MSGLAWEVSWPFHNLSPEERPNLPGKQAFPTFLLVSWAAGAPTHAEGPVMGTGVGVVSVLGPGSASGTQWDPDKSREKSPVTQVDGPGGKRRGFGGVETDQKCR